MLTVILMILITILDNHKKFNHTEVILIKEKINYQTKNHKMIVKDLIKIIKVFIEENNLKISFSSFKNKLRKSIRLLEYLNLHYK